MNELDTYDECLTFPKKEKKKHNDSDRWVLSYADMVTVLLCFFIIFYAIEKQIEKRDVNPVKGYDTEEGILEKHTSSTVDAEYDYVVESLKNFDNIAVVRTSNFVDIHFKEIVFFKSGGLDLTPKGAEVVDSVVKRFRGIKSKYRLEIHGHADKTPVANKKERWWKTNMELSVMRALSVYDYLRKNNFPKEFLSVAGYGTNMSLKPQRNIANHIIEQNRRISLRLQLVE